MGAAHVRSPEAVVFDVGGVLAVPPFEGMEAYGAELGLAAGVIAGYFHGDEQFNRVERGELGVREFFLDLRTRVRDAHGVDLDLHHLAGLAREARAFRPEMMALAREVSRHHTVGVLTNNVKENDGYLAEHLTADVFSHVVNSGVAGARKPDPAAYAHLLDRLQLPAEAVVYIDDFPENLPPAEAMGITTILFESVEQCRADLVAAGVTIGALP